jgi:uncharacterized membrane protein YqjE
MPGSAQPPITYGGNTGRPLIPLVAEPDVDPNESIGALVKDATTHLSTLVRSEIELAKVELTTEIKTGVRGAVFFIGAGAIGVFSLFFFFFMLAEIIAIWLPQWAAFTIVFVLMLLMAGALAFLGYRKVKQIGKPERTISTLTESAAALKAAATHTEPTVSR